MKRVNSKNYYAHIGIDTYINILDKVFNIFEEYRKAEQAYQRKIRYHKAYYSLDRGDGIEHSVLFVSLSSDEIYERKLATEQLYAATAATGKTHLCSLIFRNEFCFFSSFQFWLCPLLI